MSTLGALLVDELSELTGVVNGSNKSLPTDMPDGAGGEEADPAVHCGVGAKVLVGHNALTLGDVAWNSPVDAVSAAGLFSPRSANKFSVPMLGGSVEDSFLSEEHARASCSTPKQSLLPVAAVGTVNEATAAGSNSADHSNDVAFVVLCTSGLGHADAVKLDGLDPPDGTTSLVSRLVLDLWMGSASIRPATPC